MEPVWRSGGDGEVLVRVHAQPGARRAGVVGRHGDALKVAVRAKAQGGSANDALCAVRADALGLAPRQVRVAAGARGRRKVLAVRTDQPARVGQRLDGLVGDPAGEQDPPGQG